MKKLFFAVLLFVTTAAFAQIPGYQGLKFSVKYDCGIMHPAILGRPGKLPMLYHNGSIDYVISRKFSVGVKYGFMFYKAPPDKQIFYTDYYYDESGLNRNDYKGQYTQHTVALVFKHFMRRRGFIAPVGRYFTYGVYYQYASNHFVEYQSSQLGGFHAVTHTAGIILGTGRNFVVANRILIDVGANINVSPYLIDQDDRGDFVQRELILRNLLQVYLGFGVLAF